MDIVLPINFAYLKGRYRQGDELSDFIRDLVVPNLVERFTLDSRVSSVELISDFDFRTVVAGFEKAVVTHHGIDTSFDSDEVAAEIINVRQSKSPVIVQGNPLFPFVSVAALVRAYGAVQSGAVASAVGATVERSSIQDRSLGTEYDLGIFTVYSVASFGSGQHRLTPPFNAVGLAAVELIGLRNADDFDLFNLILNSGFLI